MLLSGYSLKNDYRKAFMPEFPNQQTLFRNTDPETSRLAAEDLTRRGKRGHQKQQILSYLKTCVGYETSAEIARWGQMDRHMVARRLPDLERDGLVERCGLGECRVTGHQAVTWRVRV